ncbi:hypothetical protein [Anaerobacillus alkalidiazotrophicus]|uniref:hypothetical protein n=1 Tax=Anaerobacillus alkalidiazotrophicus TaxID=472963 RepID=UPI0014719D80|nr:hypothetical protein [Anaerobacillus alkalidiazotrophicus]
MQYFTVKTVEETYKQIKELVKSVQETEEMPLESSLHRIVAEDVVSTGGQGNRNSPNE